jgi:putative Mg2+ transporter-C (MgtC) family protein
MFDSFIETDWLLLIAQLALAMVLGYLIGMERELHGKVVGTRTISLIAIGSALYVLMSPSIIDGDNSRIIAQVVSGIGFLGAGIIFKDGDTIKGLTTAATVWCAAAIGCLCGAGMFAQAILGAAAIIGVNVLFKHLKHEDHEHKEEKEK